MLTPVDYREGIYWKRDDLFRPFGEYHVNGGKVRQAIQLFETKIDEIRSRHNNGVITAASVHSPQSANIGKVAQLYGVLCIAAVGGTKPENLDKLPMMRLTQYYGASIRIVAGHGMSPVIHARMRDIAKETGYLPIEMGELMETNPKEIFETTAAQVENIPDELDNLIIPTGVAIQTTGILIVAKNRKYAQLFTSLFRIRKIHKTYLGIVIGELQKNKDTFVDELFHYEGEKKVKTKAITHFTVLDSNNNYSLLKLIPETGRKHQLRKQLLMRGYPVLGDSKSVSYTHLTLPTKA